MAIASAVGVARADAALRLPGPGLTASSPSWAPAASAAIHPGVQTFTNGGQCTANFVFTDGVNVFIGQAAHCAGTGGATDTNGCTAGSLPLGTEVTVSGAGHPGKMVYSSWIAMQAAHEKNANACDGNDFALVKLHPADVAPVNPSIPQWGGPAGVNTTGTSVGDVVYSYGNSELRLGLSPLSPKVGISLGDDFGGWIHNVYTVTPGIPGDSGSAVVDSVGKALGVLRTVELAPITGANQIGDLGRQLSYARASIPHLQLVNGTQAFTPLI